MADFTIRKANPSDLEGICTVYSQADILHQQAHPDIFKSVDDPADIKDFILTSIQSDDAVVFVAEAVGDILGVVIAWVRQTPDVSIMIKKTYLSVNNLVVDEKYHQQGIGLALMEKVHNWGMDRGLKDIRLTVWDFNQSALAFYRKLGYEALHHYMRKVLT